MATLRRWATGDIATRRRARLAVAASAVLVSVGFAALAAWSLRAATLEPLDDDRRQQQLVFLDWALQGGAAERAQQLFPEGFFSSTC